MKKILAVKAYKSVFHCNPRKPMMVYSVGGLCTRRHHFKAKIPKKTFPTPFVAFDQARGFPKSGDVGLYTDKGPRLFSR